MDTLATLISNKIIAEALAALILLALILLILNIRLMALGRRYKRLMRGVKVDNLEDLLQQAIDTNRENDRRIELLEESVVQLQGAAARAFHRIGFVRFNAFVGGGSDLSFVIAILNDQGDGLVLCCLMNRDDCRLYSKKLVGERCDQLLSKEERLAIDQAMGRAD